MAARIVSIRQVRLDVIAERINSAHARATDAAAKVVQYAVEAGQLLHQAKAAMEHGQWGGWLAANVELSARMCRNYMRLATEYQEMSKPNRQRVADLPLREALKAIVGAGKPDQKLSGYEEWYTPPEYIERVRACLGQIDLDPASSKRAQQTVRAARFFSVFENGLTHDWNGRVYLNPPFTSGKISLFTDKLVDQFEKGNVREAICLTNSYTDTQWFHKLAGRSSAICFPQQRIRFIGSRSQEASPPFGQVFTYFGRGVIRFKQQFGPIGLVVVPS